MAIKEVGYVSKAMIRDAITPRPNWGLISITDPTDNFVPPIGWHCVLSLKFHDIKQMQSEHSKFITFCHADANAIIDFIKTVENKIDGIMVHCDAGVSRSGAVAYFLAEVYGLDSVCIGHKRHEIVSSNLYVNPLVLQILRNRWSDEKLRNV